MFSPSRVEGCISLFHYFTLITSRTCDHNRTFRIEVKKLTPFYWKSTCRVMLRKPNIHWSIQYTTCSHAWQLKFWVFCRVQWAFNSGSKGLMNLERQINNTELPLLSSNTATHFSYRLSASTEPTELAWQIPMACIVLRYSWWWTVDLSETCGILYQINFEK